MATQQDRTPLLPRTPPSLTTQKTIILCDYGVTMLGDKALGTVLSQRTRTSGSGKTGVRMTLDIKATPLLANLNGVELGKGPSEAIRALLEAQTVRISEQVSPATQKFREQMQRGYNGQSEGGPTVLRRGAQVAVKRSSIQLANARYRGGRSEPREPNRTKRIGNDSGRLSHGWFVTQNPKEGAWTVNVPANRFSMETWGGDEASMQAWIARFVSLVPALRDPRSILSEQSFRKAVASAPAVVALTRSNMQILRDYITYANRTIGGAGQIVDSLGG